VWDLGVKIQYLGSRVQGFGLRGEGFRPGGRDSEFGVEESEIRLSLEGGAFKLLWGLGIKFYLKTLFGFKLFLFDTSLRWTTVSGNGRNRTNRGILLSQNVFIIYYAKSTPPQKNQRIVQCY